MKCSSACAWSLPLPRPRPTDQTQHVFAGIPALANAGPVAPRPLALHPLFNARALAQLEQLGLANCFECAHLAFAAIGAVASNPLRARGLGHAFQQGRQPMILVMPRMLGATP